MIILFIGGALLAGLLIQRAITSSPMPLEEHEEYQHGTDTVFVIFLIVAALCIAVLALPGIALGLEVTR